MGPFGLREWWQAMEIFDLGPEPEWLTCSCGELTNRVPCWTCTRELERRSDKTRALADCTRTIPAAYAWSALNAPELPERVKAHASLKTLSQLILAAANVVFVGPAGAGKTSFAVACLRERLSEGGIYVSAVHLGQASIRHKAGQGDAPIVEQAATAPLVLIDDVGSEAPTAVSALPEVIFRRHEHALPTWVTTGLKFRDMQARYGDGIARRIVERAMVVKLGAKEETT